MSNYRILRPLASGIAVLAVGVASAFGGLGIKSEITHAQPPAPSAQTSQGPENLCPTEDSPGPCFWDAKTQGNHKGRSFWVLADGTVAHVTDRATAYDMYLLAYGEGNGCKEDFDANYHGTKFISDLPEKLPAGDGRGPHVPRRRRVPGVPDDGGLPERVRDRGARGRAHHPGHRARCLRRAVLTMSTYVINTTSAVVHTIHCLTGPKNGRRAADYVAMPLIVLGYLPTRLFCKHCCSHLITIRGGR